MEFSIDEQLAKPRPESVTNLPLPKDNSVIPGAPLRKIGPYTPSSDDWRDEVLYFLLVDRFSDGSERPDNLLSREKIEKGTLGAAERPIVSGHSTWMWNLWAKSGSTRYQGGTLQGVKSKLEYLKGLGITVIWLSPIFKQRANLNTYHGYGVQDFLEVDPRFGTREDLVDLVKSAHENGIRVILDVIFNHSGGNFVYENNMETPGFVCKQDQNCLDNHCDCNAKAYKFGNWRNKWEENINNPPEIRDKDDAVWPREFQKVESYTLCGYSEGGLGRGDILDPCAEHKLSDFNSLRDFNLENPDTLNTLIQCYKYWIALTDCDGFRIDTLKHVTREHARKFCGAIKEYASSIGKADFFIVAEVAGGDNFAATYLEADRRDLNAALDIGENRLALRRLAKGMEPKAAREFFSGFEVTEQTRELMPSHRALGEKHVSILDDHDHVFGEKIRFSHQASKNQVLVGVALQMFILGIPCIYYGTEQAFSGPEPNVVKEFLISEGWNDRSNYGDRFLREAMFGPKNPLKPGLEGRDSDPKERYDEHLPGFGPFGTAGYHCFDQNSFTYLKIREMIGVRRKYASLRYGRQYQRQISYLTYPFSLEYEAGQIVAWSRILADEEVVCIINSNGAQTRGGRVVVDSRLNKTGRKMHLILNTTESSHPETVEVKEDVSGYHYIEVNDLEPCGVLAYVNGKATGH
jgi:glycosidase